MFLFLSAFIACSGGSEPAQQETPTTTEAPKTELTVEVAEPTTTTATQETTAVESDTEKTETTTAQ